MTQVRLLPNSVYHDHQEWNRAYMQRLDPDRMLYMFRANAWPAHGRRETARRVGAAGERHRRKRVARPFPGPFPAQRAALRSTGDKAAKSKADYMVAEMASAEKLGGE